MACIPSSDVSVLRLLNSSGNMALAIQMKDDCSLGSTHEGGTCVWIGGQETYRCSSQNEEAIRGHVCIVSSGKQLTQEV